MNELLNIVPNEYLPFKIQTPFNVPCTTYMRLTNVVDQVVSFKIKTTAPKHYLVRPNSGFVEAQGFVDVAVTLQPCDVNEIPKIKHKFMLMALVVSGTEVPLEQIWNAVNPDDFKSAKLKCMFEIEPVESGPKVQSHLASSSRSPASIYSAKVSGQQDLSVPATTAPKVDNQGKLLFDNVVRSDMLHLHEDIRRVRSKNCALKVELATMKGKGTAMDRSSSGQQTFQLNKWTALTFGIFLSLFCFFVLKYFYF